MGYDRISELPDSLLTQILSYLPTKDSVKTSALSKRWESLWLRVPALDLRVNDVPLDVFPSFIENFLEFNKKSRMQKLKIRYEEDSPYCDRFPEWIGTAVDRGIQHLDVETDIMDACVMIDPMPRNIYKSNTLVSLYLVAVGIETPEFDISLPCLKIMHLEELLYDDDEVPLMLEKLISGSPVLEDLTLIRPILFYDQHVLWFMRVSSQALKRFRCTFYNCSMGRTKFSVEIDAPRLEYMSLQDYQPDRIVVKNLSSLFMIDIDSEFNVKYLKKRDIFHAFLNGISKVRHMIISQTTLEVLYRYSKLGNIPKFDNLYRLQARLSSSEFGDLYGLQARLSSSMLQVLPVFLERCPNLRNLILEDTAISTDPEETELTLVPQCLLSTLECVEIHTLITMEESGKKLIRYFLENSVVLKKLILHFRDSSIPNRNSDIFKELLTCTKRSSSCQIIICFKTSL